MISIKQTTIALGLLLILFSCDDNENIDDSNTSSTTISGFKFIGEQIIPDGKLFEGQTIGGLSSIDYHNNLYYIISDAPNTPIRYYTAKLNFDASDFNHVTIINQIELLNKQGTSFGDTEVDPESIRFDPITGTIVWTSEGFANNQIDPFVREADVTGKFVKEYTLPNMFKSTIATDKGIRNNGAFEGLSLSVDGKGYWIAMELPLKQDGSEPEFGKDTNSKVRIAYVDRATNKFGRQFTYDLGRVKREGGFTINGLVEVLEYTTNKFLILERSFASGQDDGGNDVLIYNVDASNATDVSSFEKLENTVVSSTKNLLFDFNDIRDQLSSVPGNNAKVVDNLEGMTFGPDLKNGNKSLVLVADNNFSAFGAQLNQFIVLEVLP